MEKQAIRQTAFRLLHFIVSKVDMSIHDHIVLPDADNLEIVVSSGLVFNNQDTRIFSVGYEVEISSEETSLKIHLDARAFFEAKDELTEEDKNSTLLKTNAPAIGFPFVRSFINTLTTNAGLSSLILPTFNFLNTDKEDNL